MKTSVNPIVCFGEYKLDSTRRVLEKDGTSVNLNPKTIDLLIVLIENHGKVVSKNDLLDKVWTDQFVEENNLTVHVAALRKALGEKKGDHRFIVTVPGRGYSFVAVVDEEIEKKPVGSWHSAEIESANGEGQFAKGKAQFSKSLIGRTREISEIENLVRGDELRLLTLTGAGGSGKTSLARAVGAELTADFADGVFFIELAAVNTPELVVSVIAQTLGVKESGEKLLIDVLIDFLRERRILLILDNFEQILSAAPVFQRFVNSTEFLKILVTSRAPLQIDFEREMIVTPLALPPLNAVSTNVNDYAAIELFVRRAQSSRKSFVLTNENAASVADICRRLDGLPLAIELAAARVKLLSPPSILERLEHSLNILTGGNQDLPARQRTMRGAIEWSYDLLDKDEKIVFCQLSVFAGGFTVEAAEAVCGSDQPILDLLTSLAQNNLLTINEQDTGNMRLRMLEVVREFALELLKETVEIDDLQRIHVQYFLSIAEGAEPFLEGEAGGEWLKKLENDHDNIRAALRWSLQSDPPTAARIASAIRNFWINCGHFSEGFRWCQAILDVTENSRSEARLKLLATSGVFLRNQRNLEAAQISHEKGLTESQELNNPLQIARNNQNLGVIAILRKDYAAAQGFYQEALDICREINEEMGTALVLNSLGDLEMCRGNFSAARPLLEECRSRLKTFENKRLMMTVYNNLGMLEYHEDSYQAATSNFAEVLKIARETNNKVFIAYALDGFAALAGRSENPAKSAELAGSAECIRETIGYHIEPAEEIFRDKYLSSLRSELDEKSFNAAYQIGQTLAEEEAVALAESLYSESDWLDHEITIETYKFERVIIEEEIGVYEDEPKLINEFTVSSNEKSTITDRLKNRFAAITAAILFLILAASAFGVYVWQRGHTAGNSTAFQQISIKRLTIGGNISYAALSPDGKLFAYWEGRPTTLWIGHTSGGEPIELRPSADITYHILRFSSDSNSLYYVVSGKEYPTGALFRIPVFGGVPEKLRENIKTRITFAPDMKQFAYVKNDREKATSTLIIADTDGASEREIISRPLKFEISFSSPAWAADGKTIAVGAKSEESGGKSHEVFAVSAVDGQITQLTKQNFRAVESSAWLHDGSGLVLTAGEQPLQDTQLWFVSYPDGAVRQINPDLNNYGTALGVSADGGTILAVQNEYSSNIWIAPTDDFAQAKQLTFSALGAKYGRLGLEWTPDNRLIYTAITDKSQTLWTMNADGSNQKKLTPDGFIDLAPSITDDGRIVVFSSNRSGIFEVWRVNADGGNLRQITFSGGNEMPSVSPDGNWVVYISTIDGLNTVWRIPLEGGEPFKISDRAASSVSVSTDSRFVACDYDKNGERKLAILPIEGGAPLKFFDLSPTANLRYALHWMPDGKTITYRDWEYGFWRQSLDGGAAQKIEGLPKEKFFASDWSPDGKHFAFARAPGIRDVVLIRNTK